MADRLLPEAAAVEPSTPVSRAEYQFHQRKRKLAQSLERVKRILERSKRAGTMSDGNEITEAAPTVAECK